MYYNWDLSILLNFCVQYYFGDANLEKDKFLNAEIKKDEGWVTLATLLTFNRLKAMTEDPDVIMAALKKSTNDLLEVLLNFLCTISAVNISSYVIIGA